ncbi:hypothetical protein lerEdw1_016558 [Lerista edwardsae]|nr:hypothetical protein lerEdw1_016558 [Lerista edwardsae]
MMLLPLLVLSFVAVVEPYWNYGCYGDLRTIDVPVTSCGNALDTTSCGIPAIERAARTDLVYLRRYEVPILNVARNLCVQPALIAALISGESRAGSILVNGWNRGRSRYGLMQIHSRYYPIIGAWNSEENINQGMTILITNIRSLRRRFPNWTWQQCWRVSLGNIMDVDTTGASLETAKQEGLSAGGVAASESIAERDLKNLEKYKASIEKVGKETGMDAAVIAAIISRESHAGKTLKDGWGDRGNGFGLMQVDKRSHTPVGKWDSEEHMTQATQILLNQIKAIQNKFPQWTKEQQLKGGISAYNAGTKNVRTYEKMDIGTTKNDYASDVVARAKFYKNQGYGV